MGFTAIILEGNALSVINKINQPSPTLSGIGNLIEDVKNMMKLLKGCKVQHVKREANEATHLLAKSACLVEEEVYWVEDYPNFLCIVISRECNSLSV